MLLMIMVIVMILAYNAQGRDVRCFYNFLSQLLAQVARCLISTKINNKDTAATACVFPCSYRLVGQHDEAFSKISLDVRNCVCIPLYITHKCKLTARVRRTVASQTLCAQLRTCCSLVPALYPARRH
jgi:hypothetical protein